MSSRGNDLARRRMASASDRFLYPPWREGCQSRMSGERSSGLAVISLQERICSKSAEVGIMALATLGAQKRLSSPDQASKPLVLTATLIAYTAIANANI
jgi:hypothetical protein